MGHSRKKLDLTGQRYGKLTVLSPAKNIGQRTAWNCQCECGRETIVKTVHLRSGHVRSCGPLCGLNSGTFGSGGLSSLTYVDGTCVEMLRANTIRKNNSSGVPGVDWRASKGRWRASICFKGRRYYLGSFEHLEDAVMARKRAEERLVQPFLEQFENTSGDMQ